MIRVRVELRVDRDNCGILSVTDAHGRGVLGPFAVAARASDALARSNGNPTRDSLLRYGDTPTGGYVVRESLKSGSGTRFSVAEFGPHGVVVLEGVSDDAAIAEANGRFHFLIQGGKPTKGGQLRSTAGALRLANDNVRRLVSLLRKHSRVQCEISEHASVARGATVFDDGNCDHQDPLPIASSSLTAATGALSRRDALLSGSAGAMTFGLSVAFVGFESAAPARAYTRLAYNEPPETPTVPGTGSPGHAPYQEPPPPGETRPESSPSSSEVPPATEAPSTPAAETSPAAPPSSPAPIASPDYVGPAETPSTSGAPPVDLSGKQGVPNDLKEPPSAPAPTEQPATPEAPTTTAQPATPEAPPTTPATTEAPATPPPATETAAPPPTNGAATPTETTAQPPANEAPAAPTTTAEPQNAAAPPTEQPPSAAGQPPAPQTGQTNETPAVQPAENAAPAQAPAPTEATNPNGQGPQPLPDAEKNAITNDAPSSGKPSSSQPTQSSAHPTNGQGGKIEPYSQSKPAPAQDLQAPEVTTAPSAPNGQSAPTTGPAGSELQQLGTGQAPAGGVFEGNTHSRDYVTPSQNAPPTPSAAPAEPTVTPEQQKVLDADATYQQDLAAQKAAEKAAADSVAKQQQIQQQMKTADAAKRGQLQVDLTNALDDESKAKNAAAAAQINADTEKKKVLKPGAPILNPKK